LKSSRSSHLVPLITRLQAWGYDNSAVKPVAKVVEKLDAATLSLIERLVHDLTQLNDCSHDLRNQVNVLTGELDNEKQLLDRLRGENQRLLRENSELRAQVRKICRPFYMYRIFHVCLELLCLLVVFLELRSIPRIGRTRELVGTYFKYVIWMADYPNQN
jgi:hypothetical protein